MHATRIISEADIVPDVWQGIDSSRSKSKIRSGSRPVTTRWRMGGPRDASRFYRLGAAGSHSSTPQRRELVENLSAADAFKPRMDLHGSWSDKVKMIFIIMTAFGKDLKRC
jgi:hypothetical protein